MFERISNGIAIARSSWRVLMMDKELALFPVMSGVACILVLATFAAPIVVSPEIRDFLVASLPQQGEGEMEAAQPDPVRAAIPWVLLFIFYVCSYFVIVFFNSALICCALIRFGGGNPTLADGLRGASSRLPQIFAWALVSATVGLILRMIESKSERVGQIVSGLLGAAWTITTFFVVPVLVVERLGPIDACKRSVAIMRQTWGETLVGRIGLGFVNFLFVVVPMLVIMGGFALMNDNPEIGIAVASIGGVGVLVGLAMAAALQGIYLAALYQFAVGGQLPDAFDTDTLSRAFGSKNSNV